MANFRDNLNAYGAKNDPAMARSGNANQYADLPNPQRAQEIVAEARRRVAASGGDPRNLQPMIQRVAREMQDVEGPHGYQQPNNIESYIDKVLGMSGMLGAQNAGGVPTPSSAPEQSYGAPVGDVERGGDLPPATENPDNVEGDESGDGLGSFGMVAAGILATAGAAGLARYLAGLRNQVPNSGITDDQIAGAADGNIVRSATDEMIDQVEGADTTERQARLPAPEQQRLLEGPRNALPNASAQQALPAPSAVDEAIDATIADPDADIQSRVEGRDPTARPGPNRFANTAQSQATPDEAVAGVIDQAVEMANQGQVRQAVSMLREQGVEIDDNMMRMLVEGSNTFKTLRERAGNVAGGAVAPAIRNAVR